MFHKSFKQCTETKLDKMCLGFPLESDPEAPCSRSTCNRTSIANANQQCSSSTQRFPALPLNISRNNLSDPTAVLVIHATGEWRVTKLPDQETSASGSLSESYESFATSHNMITGSPPRKHPLVIVPRNLIFIDNNILVCRIQSVMIY